MIRELRIANQVEVDEFMRGKRKCVAAEKISPGDAVVFVLLKDGRLAAYRAVGEKVQAWLRSELPKH